MVIVEPEPCGRVAVQCRTPEFRAHVGGIELARHLAQQDGEVLPVADVRQEPGVCLTVEIPVHAVHVGAIEPLLRLPPCVVKQVFHLGAWVQLDLSRERDRRTLPVGQGDTLDAARPLEKEVLPLSIGRIVPSRDRLAGHGCDPGAAESDAQNAQAGGRGHGGDEDRLAVRRRRVVLVGAGKWRDPRHPTLDALEFRLPRHVSLRGCTLGGSRHIRRSWCRHHRVVRRVEGIERRLGQEGGIDVCLRCREIGGAQSSTGGQEEDRLAVR